MSMAGEPGVDERTVLRLTIKYYLAEAIAKDDIQIIHLPLLPGVLRQIASDLVAYPDQLSETVEDIRQTVPK